MGIKDKLKQAAAAGAVATAVGGLGMAGVASASTAASVKKDAPSAVGTCLTRYVNASPGIGQGTLGSTYLVIVFKNLNNVPCTIKGYPAVQLALGLPIKLRGLPSAHEPGTTPHIVTVKRGAYFNALLRLIDPGVYGCKIVKTNWVQILFPGGASGLYFPYKAETCAKRRTLTVGPFLPGKGSA